MTIIHALKPGTSIAGYNIVRVLGSGGFGITYEADSPFTGKRVAIKEFFPRGIASREGNTRIIYAERDAELVEWALRRFESSTLDQCKLRHPNIVDVVHYVKDNNTGYMIMEFVEGDTLEEWLRARGDVPGEGELRPLIEPLFSALDYLHEHKMIHRDIAPDNIMLRADGRPVIIDFGAIKLIEKETRIRTDKSYVVAKQFYSPPEQIQEDGELDERADIYALGAVLYRSAGGRPPANAEERMQKLAFGKRDSFVPLAEIAPELSPLFTDAIDRALAFHADDRHESIAEFSGALGWDSGVSPARTVPLKRERVRIQSRRGAWSALLWLLPLAGLVAIGIAVLFAAGILELPVAKPKAVKTDPLPKMDTMVVPEIPIFTPPAPPKADVPEEPADTEPQPNQNR